MEFLRFDDSGYGDELLAGVFVTFELAILAFVLALASGIVLGVAALARNVVAQAVWRIYASVFMGVPSILIIFLVFFNAPILLKDVFNLRVEVSPFVAGLIALAMVYAAYIAEVIRGGVTNIPQGQWDAARALGLGKVHLWRLVILPQVWRISLPGITNVWMTTLKDTALVSLVGLTDLVRMANVAAIVSNQPFFFYTLAALVFIAVSGLTVVGAERIERWAYRGQDKTDGG